MRPLKQDYISYFEHYINLVHENDIISALQNNHQAHISFFKSLPNNKLNYRYQDKKWTVQQVINHIIDTERVFSYRALCFSRGDNQIFPSFDENKYAENAFLNLSTFNILIEEFDAVRKATILQFKQLSEKELLLKGKTSSGENNVLSLGYMICGHATHHINVIKERYLN